MPRTPRHPSTPPLPTPVLRPGRARPPRAHRRRPAAALAAGALLLTGCAFEGAPTGPAAEADRATATAAQGTITLTVGEFGTFGYHEAGLYHEYMAAHPEINIHTQITQDGQAYWDALAPKLALSTGLADIQAVEVGYIAQATSTYADAFTDLLGTPGVDPAAWLPWKAQQGTTADGRMIGLGTDIGPMAVCYRKDLFRKAGLPTDREAVADLWRGDWNRFVDVGRRYQAAAPKGTFFTDSVGGLFNAVLSSEPQQYSDPSGRLDPQDSPGVKKAWDVAVRAAQGGMSAGLTQFQGSWNSAFYLSRFATVVCPSWMTGLISSQSDDSASGQWDIAQAPVAGNWGGAFLTVPKAGGHPKEAAALAAWLTAPEQQAKVFAKVGNLPSTVAALKLPAVQQTKLDFFGDAPVGRTYAAAAQYIRPAPIGRDDGTAKTVLTETGLQAVERDGTDPKTAWNDALKLIRQKTGG
ncbi:ABC transporter substrate-binding protein [Kitasatospora sp. NPDC057015]|uniref:ABC transporter substrate-binding protein n=1 Tax=Kitasatospora sp. NPDC057015 TaxID=3346001 RepID=UPI00364218F5